MIHDWPLESDMSDRWLAAFRQDPQKAVSDLFGGRAGAGATMRLDVPELLRMWFPPNSAVDRAQLDDALLAWLVEMRESYTSQVERLGFSVYVKRVADALVALQLLDLPQARDEIRKEVDDWLRWLTPLRLGSARDPALECYRLLPRPTRHAAHAHMAAPRGGRSPRIPDRGPSWAAAAARRRRQEEPCPDAASVANSRSRDF